MGDTDAGDDDAGFVVPDGGPVDAGPRDGGPPDAGPVDAGPPDAGRVDAGPADAGPPRCSPALGRLVITEVMIASQAGTDNGEWFEIENPGTCAVDLTGLVLSSPTSAGEPVMHTMTGGTVAPGQYFVLALSADPVQNHDLDFDYVYGTGALSDIYLGNSGDELSIWYGGVELDYVAWDATGFTRGYARQFPRATALDLNDDWSLWCDATGIYSTSAGGPFYGTPGSRNGTCP